MNAPALKVWEQRTPSSLGDGWTLAFDVIDYPAREGGPVFHVRAGGHVFETKPNKGEAITAAQDLLASYVAEKEGDTA